MPEKPTKPKRANLVEPTTTTTTTITEVVRFPSSPVLECLLISALVVHAVVHDYDCVQPPPVTIASVRQSAARRSEA